MNAVSCLGCDPCGSCSIFASTFAALTGLTQDAGSWTSTSNTARTTSSNAQLSIDAVHPDSIPSHYVSVGVYGGSADEVKVGVVGSHYAKLSYGGDTEHGCLAIYDSADVLLTKMRVDAATTTTATLLFWYGNAPVADGGDSQIAVQFNGGAVLRMNVTLAGTAVYLGTGTVGTGVRFSNLDYQRHYVVSTDESCPKPPAPTCTIFTDSIGRADSGDVGCSYTETAGAASVVGGKIRFAASANAKLTCEVRHPQGANAVQQEWTVRSSASGDKIKMYTSTVDDNYAELTIGTNTLKVFGAGVLLATAGVTANINTDYTVTVTHVHGVLSAKLGSVCVSHGLAQPAGAVYVGVGTGTCTGNVDVDDFTFLRGADSSNPTCQEPCTDCAAICSGAETIYAVVIRWAGITNKDCADCTDINGVDIELPFNATVGTECIFLLNDQDGTHGLFPACDTPDGFGDFISEMYVRIPKIAGTIFADVEFHNEGFYFDTWQSAFTPAVNCATYFENLPLVSAGTSSWFAGPCDFQSATMQITTVLYS